MTYAVLGDIHANLQALTAVLDDVESRDVDAILSLGDVVGYGGDPIACLDLVRERCVAVVKGNHDAMIAESGPLTGINAWAEAATLWTRLELDDARRAWLDALPLVHCPEPGLLLAHGSPADPERWPYLELIVTVHAAFEAMSEPVCIVGHTHRPRHYTARGERVVGRDLQDGPLEPDARHILNAGSVGQPRDGDPRAAWLLYDAKTRRVELRRVPYDIDGAAAAIRRAGLPDALAERLADGR